MSRFFFLFWTDVVRDIECFVTARLKTHLAYRFLSWSIEHSPENRTLSSTELSANSFSGANQSESNKSIPIALRSLDSVRLSSATQHNRTRISNCQLNGLDLTKLLLGLQRPYIYIEYNRTNNRNNAPSPKTIRAAKMIKQ